MARRAAAQTSNYIHLVADSLPGHRPSPLPPHISATGNYNVSSKLVDYTLRPHSNAFRRCSKQFFPIFPNFFKRRRRRVTGSIDLHIRSNGWADRNDKANEWMELWLFRKIISATRWPAVNK